MPAEGLAAHHWYLEIDGITEGVFKEVSGIDSENEIIEHRVAGKGGNIIIHKVPGVLKWSNIVMKRGVTDDEKLWKWRHDIEQGKVETSRKNGSITMYAPDGKQIAKYTFRNGWPSKFVGPSLDSSKNEIAIEEFHIAHEGLERQA
jgi:phage tail-like protein